MAAMEMTAGMARQMNDEAFAQRLDAAVAEARAALDKYLWDDGIGYYRNFHNIETGKKSDHIFAYQLDGDWMARFNGVPNVFAPDKAKRTLETVWKNNVPHTRYGAVNLTNPDGTIMPTGGFPLSAFYEPYDFFTPELFMLSMTYLYAGDQERGLELGKRCQFNVAIEHGMSWDGANVVRGDTGERGFGHDYYQNMVMWAYPAAIANQDIAGPAKDGGLVERVIKAAKAE
jgi:uncharacterized protein (DUF608 family)